jgi:serine protease Do
MRKLIVIVVILIAILGIWNAAVIYYPSFSAFIKNHNVNLPSQKIEVVTEESVTIDTVKKVGPSVVTVEEEMSSASKNSYNFGPFSIFGLPQQSIPSEPQAIGSGFIVSKDGLVVTSKHVVSDIGVKYQIITADGKKFKVENIYRDPLNDIAILKITSPTGELKAVTMGDSSNLQVGQFVIAIGTALGEFRSTVTTGVISGLGRGITAGSEFEGFVEKLDNVIQTDAAINPGNSGGPLVNSKAQVIGINTAVASGGQNIGFALPINIVKDSLNNFNKTGQFNRPYLGVTYQILNKDVATYNNVPQGAYVQSVIVGSPAEKAGILQGDIILSINGKKINDQDNTVSSLIVTKKIGDIVSLSVWRDGKTFEVKAALGAAPNQ